jgi:hypothetical protein
MNSKKLAIAAILGLLLLGAAGFGIYTKKMNTVGFRGIGLTVQGVEQETVDDWVNTFNEVLKEEEVLQAIIEKSDYVAKLGVPEGEAVAHLREAANVNFSKTRNTIQIGLMGKRKNNAALDGISNDVFNAAAPQVAQLKPEFGAHYQRISKGGQ